MLQNARHWYGERGFWFSLFETYAAYRLSGVVATNFTDSPLTSWASPLTMVADLGRKAYEICPVAPFELLVYTGKNVVMGLYTAVSHPLSLDAWGHFGRSLGSLHTLQNFQHGELKDSGLERFIQSFPSGDMFAGGLSEIINVGFGAAIFYGSYSRVKRLRSQAINIKKEPLEVVAAYEHRQY